jgi:hypothetical protein
LASRVGLVLAKEAMMADTKDLKQIMARLESLEGKIATVGRRPTVSRLEAVDIAAYHKVQNAFWEDGTCGINETSPCILRCNVVTGGKVTPIPKPCDFECTCGPCNIWGPVLGGGFRFRGLG